ncbi:hypothetical protein TNCV_1448611 [Trichonephila clavipes]|nr:hypothetical protein TNCV_1448611 [Trichonephila clavipes]
MYMFPYSESARNGSVGRLRAHWPCERTPPTTMASQAESRVDSTGSHLDLRIAKDIISTYIDKYTGMTQKYEEFWKAMGNSGHCGPKTEAPGESRDCYPLSPNYWT